jgi:hypothetical protein
MWDSSAALERHGDECEAIRANGGNFDRDDLIVAAEAMLKKLDPEMEFRVFLAALTVTQMSRERGVRQPNGSYRFEAEDHEMMLKMIEVGSWYGLSEREVLNL